MPIGLFLRTITPHFTPKKEKDRERLAEREGLDEFTEIRGFEDRKFKIRVEPSNTDRLSGKSGLTVSGACFVKK